MGEFEKNMLIAILQSQLKIEVVKRESTKYKYNSSERDYVNIIINEIERQLKELNNTTTEQDFT